ncbi:hypothetical protein AAC27_003072 [Salmonella enterica subsp. diarizonae]|nr:hypothetical protein [Salmonella enterica subsp. diarizonae]
MTAIQKPFLFSKRLADNNQSQVDILNQRLAATAPRVPQAGLLENLI